VPHYQLYLGANIVFFHQSFARSGTYPTWTQANAGEQPFANMAYPEVSNSGAPQPIPLIAAAFRLNPKLVLGAGLFAPQGYPNRDYDETISIAGVSTRATPQRYDTVSQSSIAAFPSLSLAYRVTPKLDVGVRASWGFGNLQAKTVLWGLPGNTQEDYEQDAVFDVDVKDSFIPTYGVGVLLRPTDDIELGAAFNSQSTLDGYGTGGNVLGSRTVVGGEPTIILPTDDPRVGSTPQCGKGGTQAELKACVKLVLPMSAQLGGRYKLRDGAGKEQGDIELDLRWENWSAAKDIQVVVDGHAGQMDNMGNFVDVFTLRKVLIHHGFRDVFSVRVGGSWLVQKLELRYGLSYDTAAAPNSWQRLDIDGSQRFQGALGASYPVSDKVKLDLGAAYIYSPNRTVTQVAIANTSDRKQFVQPNPILPVLEDGNQPYQPINNGTFKSGYYVVAVGATAAW
jgi:long-subunit fatty acid transport protein